MQNTNEGEVYDQAFTCFEKNGMVYLMMEGPTDETNIGNRRRWDQTYAYRLQHGTPP